MAGLQLDGDAERIAEWLGAHDLPITLRVGHPAVAAGEIVLGADQL